MAEEKANEGGMSLDISGKCLVASGKPYYEKDGFTVTVDSKGENIAIVSWEGSYEGKAYELRELAEKTGEETRKWLKLNGILSVPQSTNALRKVVKAPTKCDLLCARTILKDQFPHSRITKLTANGSHLVIDYCTV
jgi:hypothetical protein